jgi:hypothetical protein
MWFFDPGAGVGTPHPVLPYLDGGGRHCIDDSRHNSLNDIPSNAGVSSELDPE